MWGKYCRIYPEFAHTNLIFKNLFLNIYRSQTDFLYHFIILYPVLSFLLSSTTPLSTLEKQSQNYMTIIAVFNHMIKTSSYLLTACFTLSSICLSCDRFRYLPSQNSSPRSVGGAHFSRENCFEMSDLFSSLLIFTIIKTILSTLFYCFQILQNS